MVDEKEKKLRKEILKKVLEDEEEEKEKKDKQKEKLKKLFDKLKEDLEKVKKDEGEKGKDEEKDIEELNKDYLEDEKVLLEITDDTGEKTTIEISRKVLEAIKYAGELKNMDYESIKEEMELLRKEIEALDTEENQEKAQILVIINLMENALRTLSLNIAIEYKGLDETGRQVFEIREEFKKDFNWDELKDIISAIVSAETGEEFVIENADISKVLKHVEEVFLDLEAHNIEIVDKEGKYTKFKAKEAGSHVELITEEETGLVQDIQLSETTLKIKGDTEPLYEKALNVVPIETRQRLGDENVKLIIKSVVEVYVKAARKR